MHIFGRAAFVASVLCPLLVAGCAKPLVYSKNGATQVDYNRDSYECERDTRQSGYFGQCGVIIEAMHKCSYQVFFQRCMLARGWSATEQP
jgi:hypothetical protein